MHQGLQRRASRRDKPRLSQFLKHTVRIIASSCWHDQRRDCLCLQFFPVEPAAALFENSLGREISSYSTVAHGWGPLCPPSRLPRLLRSPPPFSFQSFFLLLKSLDVVKHIKPAFKQSLTASRSKSLDQDRSDPRNH